jgi:UDP-GlcNAc:undecaprenyl-phosphate GlcNAc-1-phosphate transferase
MSIISTLIALSIPVLIFKNQVDVFLLITTFGALSACLIFNFHPAKMFMGDTGSQFLGMFLAYFSIKLLWNNGLDIGDYSIFTNMTLVGVVFAVPIIDTTVVSINRLMRGDSPMKGGKDHTTHHLVYKGFTERQVVYTFIIIGLVSVLLSFVLKKYIPKESLFSLVIWVYLLALFILFFSLSRKQKNLVK